MHLYTLLLPSSWTNDWVEGSVQIKESQLNTSLLLLLTSKTRKWIKESDNGSQTTFLLSFCRLHGQVNGSENQIWSDSQHLGQRITYGVTAGIFTPLLPSLLIDVWVKPHGDIQQYYVFPCCHLYGMLKESNHRASTTAPSCSRNGQEIGIKCNVIDQSGSTSSLLLVLKWVLKNWVRCKLKYSMY